MALNGRDAVCFVVKRQREDAPLVACGTSADGLHFIGARDVANQFLDDRKTGQPTTIDGHQQVILVLEPTAHEFHHPRTTVGSADLHVSVPMLAKFSSAVSSCASVAWNGMAAVVLRRDAVIERYRERAACCDGCGQLLDLVHAAATRLHFRYGRWHDCEHQTAPVHQQTRLALSRPGYR